MSSTALASFNGAASSSAGGAPASSSSAAGDNNNSHALLDDAEEKMDEDEEGMGEIWMPVIQHASLVTLRYGVLYLLIHATAYLDGSLEVVSVRLS